MSEQNELQSVESVSETKVERGAGACSESGCNCLQYKGSGNTCENCTHNYAAHW